MAWCYSHAGDHGDMSKNHQHLFLVGLAHSPQEGCGQASCHKRHVKSRDTVFLTLHCSGSIFHFSEAITSRKRCPYRLKILSSTVILPTGECSAQVTGSKLSQGGAESRELHVQNFTSLLILAPLLCLLEMATIIYFQSP